MALVELGLGKPVEAIGALDELKTVSEKYPNLDLIYGEAYLAQKKADDAIRHLEAATRSATDKARAYLGLAQAYEMRKPGSAEANDALCRRVLRNVHRGLFQKPSRPPWEALSSSFLISNKMDGFCQILSHRLLNFSEMCAPRRCTYWSKIIDPIELKFGKMFPRALSGAEDGLLTVRICYTSGFDSP